MPDTFNIQDSFFTSFQQGKEAGFDFFFQQYYAALVYYAEQIINERALAEEIAEDSFIKLWEHREAISSATHLRNWLYLATKNACIQYQRKEKTAAKREAGFLSLVPDTEEPADTALIKAETLRQVYAALELLPEQCRKVFEKLYVEGKTVKETAAELQVTVSTINNQKARGVKLLRERIRGV